MNTSSDIHLDLVAQYTLVAGVSDAGDGWIDAIRIAALAGGGIGGSRAARDAVRHLQSLGLIDVRTLGGRTLYRRTERGQELAAEVLAADTEGELARAATMGGLGVWQPQPGDPLDLHELVGQSAAKYRIEHNLAAAEATGRPPQAMLFTGPPGHGKTLVANIVGRRLGLPVLAVSLADLGPRELAEALEIGSEQTAVVFLDEVHAGSRAVRDRLLVALDPGAPPPFIPIAATTDPGQLSGALRRRFPVEVAFIEYTLPEAVELCRRRASGAGVTLSDGLAELIARAARRSPARIATLLIEAQGLEAIAGHPIRRAEFAEHLEQSGRDADGLDQADLMLLMALRDDMNGKPAGELRLAVSCGLDREDVRGRLAQLRREKLIATGGTAGHQIAARGRERLNDAGL